MKPILMVLGFLCLMAVQAHAAKKPKAEPKLPPSACVLVEPLMERLKTSGIEYEDITSAPAVARITAAIRANTKDAAFPTPTRLVIVFIGEEAKIGIIVADKLCAVVSGPASAVRNLVHAVHGRTAGQAL